MTRRLLIAVALAALVTRAGWAQQQMATEDDQSPAFGHRLKGWGKSLFSASPSNPPPTVDSAQLQRNSGTTSRGAYSAASKKTTGNGPKVNLPGTVPPSQRRIGSPSEAPSLDEPQEPGAAPDKEESYTVQRNAAGSSRRSNTASATERLDPETTATLDRKQTVWAGSAPKADTSVRTTLSPKSTDTVQSPTSSRRNTTSPAATNSNGSSSTANAQRTNTTPRVARNQPIATVTANENIPATEHKVSTADNSPAARPIEKAGMNDDNLLLSRRSPNLSVDTVGPRKISVGKEATYKVSLRNSGDSAASDVTVFVSVPVWAEIVEARAALGTTGVAADRPEAGLQWKLNSMPAQSQQDLTLKIVPRRSQPFDLVVRWTCAPPASQATVEVEEPKLHMAISGPPEVLYGQQQLYKLSVSNPGTGDADDVVIHLLPIHSQEGSAASHRVGTLKAGATTTIEIELTARQAGQLNIRAEATGDGGLKAEAATAVLVRRAQILATVAAPKVHYAGTPVSAEIRVSNPGDATARGISIAAMLPSGAELVSASNGCRTDGKPHELLWTIEQLQPGAEQALQCKYVLKQTGVNRLEAVITGEGDLRTTAVASTQVLALADLAMEVSDTPGPVPVGDSVAYTVRVKNRGTKSAEEVEVVAYFGDNLEATAVEGGLHQIAAGVVTFRPIATLQANGETVYKITAKANKAGNHRMRVELNCKPLGARLTHELNTLFYADEAVASGQ